MDIHSLNGVPINGEIIWNEDYNFSVQRHGLELSDTILQEGYFTIQDIEYIEGKSSKIKRKKYNNGIKFYRDKK